MLCSLPDDLLFSIRKQAMLLQIEAFGPSLYEDMPDLREAGDRTMAYGLPPDCYTRVQEALNKLR